MSKEPCTDNRTSGMAVAALPDQNDGYFCYAIAAAAYIVVGTLLAVVQNAVTKGSVVWWICLAATNIVIGLSAVIYCLIRRKKLWHFVRADVAPNLVHTLCGCVFILGLVFFMAPVTNRIYDIMEQAGLSRPSVDLPMQLVPLLCTVTLLPAFSEELVFRGAVAGGLVDGYKSKVGAVLTSGALFSLFHANPAQTLHQFVVGCFLALLLLRGGSLWACVIVHFVNNLAVVLGEFFLPAGVFTSWVACIAGGIVAAIALAVYLFFVKPTEQSPVCNPVEPAATKPTALACCLVAVGVFCMMWVGNL